MPDVQGAHAFGALELVRGYREQVHVQCTDIQLHVRSRLHRVCVEQDSPVASHPLRDRGDRLDGADLVVGQHDADQDRLGRDGRFHVVGIDAAVAIHRQLHDLEPELLQVPDRVAHGVVLDRARDDSMPARLAGPGSALDGEVVGLGPAGSEDDLAGSGSDGTSYALVSLVETRPSPPSQACGPMRDCRMPSVSHGSMASRASRRSGVVAAWSR